MLHSIETCKILDYLQMFSIDLEELDDKDSLSYRVADKHYITTVKNYYNELQNEKEIILKYANKNYNLFTSLFFFFMKEHDINSINKLLEGIRNMECDIFYKILFKALSIEDTEGDDFEVINAIKASPDIKWNILFMVKCFNETKLEICDLLSRVYPKFDEYEDLLIQQVQQHAKEICKKIQFQPETYYHVIFREHIDDVIMKSYNFHSAEHYLLYMNAFIGIINRQDSKTVCITGIYMLPFYALKEHDQLYNEEIKHKVLKALADPSRLLILKMIYSGITSNKKLAELLNITPAGVSYQTNQLISVGLLTYKSSNQESNLTVNTPLIKLVFNSVLDEFDQYVVIKK